MAYSETFEYSLRDRFSSVIARMTKRAAAFQERVEKVGNRMGKMSTKLANLRTGFAVAMLAKSLKGAFDVSLEFEQAINRIEAKSQATVKQMVSLRAAAAKFGRETKFSAVAAANAMAVLAEKGYKTNQILSLMPSLLAMATAGGAELDDASSMLTGTMKAFEMEIGKANHVAGVYAVTAANSAASMKTLNAAMINAAPLAHAAGLKFEEVAALVGAMADKNIMGSKSGTLLMNAFRNLVKPTSDAIKTLQEFGFSKDQVTDTEGKIVDFTRLLELFKEKGVGIEEIFTIFQVRGAKAVASLLSQTDRARGLMGQYDDTSKALKDMARIMGQGLPKAVYEAESAWTGMQQTMMKSIEGFLISLLEMKKAFANFVAEHPKLAKFIISMQILLIVLLSIVTVVGVILASLAGLTLLASSMLGGAVTMGGVAATLGIILGIIIGITVAVTLIVIYWDKIIAGIKIAWIWVKAIYETFKYVLLFLGPIGILIFVIVTLCKLIYKYWGKIIQFLKFVLKIIILIGKFIIFMVVAWLKMWFTIGKIIGWIGKKILDLILWPFRKVAQIWDKIKGFFGGGKKSEVELTSTTKSIHDSMNSNRTEVKVLIEGGIDIHNRSGNRATPTGRGGAVPMNVTTEGDYGAYG